MLSDMLPILYIAFLGLCLWVGYKRGVKLTKPATDQADKVLNAGCQQWNAILTKERAHFALEEQSPGYLTPPRIAERRLLLEGAERLLNEAMQGSDLQARCEALGRASLACTQHKIASHIDMAEELLEAAQAAATADECGDKAIPTAALKKIEDLMSSTKRDLNAAEEQLSVPRKERGAAFTTALGPGIVTSGQSLQRAKQPLSEAAAIAKAIGLPIKSPPPPV